MWFKIAKDYAILPYFYKNLNAIFKFDGKIKKKFFWMFGAIYHKVYREKKMLI